MTWGSVCVMVGTIGLSITHPPADLVLFFVSMVLSITGAMLDVSSLKVRLSYDHYHIYSTHDCTQQKYFKVGWNLLDLLVVFTLGAYLVNRVYIDIHWCYDVKTYDYPPGDNVSHPVVCHS